MNSISRLIPLLAALPVGCISQNSSKHETEKPNVVIILADDLGYGDIGCYGATAVKTPNLDRLAAQGLRFTNAYCTSATSTPSRYSMLTGEYAWRREGTGIAPGDAAALILPGRITLPSVFNNDGYATGVVGKWHLGLGPAGGPDWNGEIAPGPLDIGFDYCFLIPATGDRVPCVYVENRRVVGLDPADPVSVSFGEKIGNEPTGRENPELLKLHPSHGHDMTIVNGISRIGYMTGGKSARWIDEDMAMTITGKAKEFIAGHRSEPFLLYFSTQDIHVPRAPNQNFAGKSGLGARGDVILQFDWAVGEIMKTLDSLKLSENTILIVTSDNGPVVDDGYKDEAVEKLSGHKPAGPLRGGKYSAFDGGTRIPFIISWNGKIKPGVSSAMISQIDLLASFASLTGQEIPENSVTDSDNNLQVLLGKSDKDRDFVVEHALNGTLSVIKGTWKYIEPSDGPKININTNTELGNDPEPQLYDLEHDTGESNNLATKNPDKVKEMSELLNQVKKGSRIL